MSIRGTSQPRSCHSAAVWGKGFVNLWAPSGRTELSPDSEWPEGSDLVELVENLGMPYGKPVPGGREKKSLLGWTQQLPGTDLGHRCSEQP